MPLLPLNAGEKTNGAFLGSIYFSMHLCLSLLLSCTEIPAQDWDPGELSSCSPRDTGGAGRCSGWHAAQLQVNTFRDSATAVPPLKYVFISPATPHAQSGGVCSASPLPCITYPPPSVTDYLANFSQRSSSLLSISDTQITPFGFYFCAARISAAPG